MKYLIILIAFIPFTINAQSILVGEDGGLATSIEVQSIADVTTVGVELGYSIIGRTDVFIGIGRSTVKNVDNLAELGFSIGAQYFALKQDDYIPLSFSIGSMYTYSKLTGNALGGADGSANTYSFLAGLYHNHEASDQVTLVPNFILSYSSTKVDLSGSESTSTGLGVGIGCSISLDVNDNLFVITPALLFADGETGFGLEFAYVIPL